MIPVPGDQPLLVAVAAICGVVVLWLLIITDFGGLRWLACLGS